MNSFSKNGRELRTNEDYEDFTKFIRKQIKRVKSDPELGKRMLYSTGMYNENGELKEEFR